MSALIIRPATVEDAAAVLEIYRPWVENSVVSFEEEVPAVAEIAACIEAALVRHAWLVAERGGEVVAYVYATTFRARAAYRWAAETAIYVAESERGVGTGRTTYGALLETLRMQGFALAIGGMTQPNAASEALHRALGFEPFGACPDIGFKHGGWHTVAWWHKRLSPTDSMVAETQPLSRVVRRSEWGTMIRAATGA